jgi:hypothetical protein
LPYTPTGVICSGWSESPPDRSAVLEDCERPAALTASSPAIVAWIELYGLRKGDTVRAKLSAPDGATLAETTAALEKDRAREFRYIGKKRPAAGWSKGAYHARYTVTRSVAGQQQTVIDVTREAAIQ